MAEFKFRNNATLHYYFSHYQKDKSVSDAFKQLNTTLTDYDVIVANNGNSPRMTKENTLRAAEAARAAGVKFLWLSTYDGKGDVWGWPKLQRQRFYHAGARHISVRDMVQGVMDFTKGAAEGIKDGHFCLPGPPVSIAVLLLQIIWALRSGTGHVG